MFGADCFFWRFQVKINGQRVELGEIEYACSKSDLVQDVVVQLYENRILVAYVEPSPPIMVSQEKGQNASRKAKILQWRSGSRCAFLATFLMSQSNLSLHILMNCTSSDTHPGHSVRPVQISQKSSTLSS